MNKYSQEQLQQFKTWVISLSEEDKKSFIEKYNTLSEEGKNIAISRVIDKVKKPFWSALGAEITPQMWQQSPYGTAIAKTAQEVATAPLHFANMAGLNLPRAVIEAMGYKYPEAETLGGQVLSKGAGVAGGIMGSPAQIFTQAPTRIFPQLAGKGALKMVGRGALGGALTGLAYTPTEAEIPVLAPKERLTQAEISIPLGIAGEFIGAGIGKISREFRKFRAKAKPSITQKVAWQKSDVIKKAQLETQNLRQQNQEVTNIIKDNIKILNNDLQKASETGSAKFQERLPEFFRNNSDAYRQRLDDISEKITGKFTKGEANKILQDTLNELDDALLTEGTPRKMIEGLTKGKYALSQVDEFGNIIQEFHSNTPIDFKSFKKDIQSIGRILSNQAKTGQRFASEDIAGAILQKNFGEYTAKKIPEFNQLQQAYKPIVQSMKIAGKIFKPYAGELQTKAGTQFLQRAGLEKLEIGERKLLEAIESGSDFAEGVGKISEPIKKIGQKILTAKEQLQALQQLKQKGITDLTARKLTRLAQLEIRKRNIIELLANKQKAQLIRKILFGATGLTGLGTYLLHRKIAETIK